MFLPLSLQSDKFSRNASLLDSGRVQQTAAMLANATLHTDTYYGSDVKVAYRLTQSLLQHECSQRGFNLTATQDIHFTEVSGITPSVVPKPRQRGRSSRRRRICRLNRRTAPLGGTRQPSTLRLQGIHHT